MRVLGRKSPLYSLTPDYAMQAKASRTGSAARAGNLHTAIAENAQAAAGTKAAGRLSIPCTEPSPELSHPTLPTC